MADLRTEEPTAHRLAEARKKGHIFKSQELVFSLTFLSFLLLLGFTGAHVFQTLLEVTRNSLSRIAPAGESGDELLRSAALTTLRLVAPYLACCILAVLAVNVVQSGFVFSPGALRLHGDRLNPIEGFKRIYSRRSLFEIVKNLAKVVVAGVIIWFFIRDEFLHSRAYMHGNPASSFGHFSGCIMSLLRRMTVAFCVLGVLDYLYQRHEYYRNMRMTRQEVKDEYKQLEGDPFLKQRQHVVRVKMLRTRMMENVKKARVVITNPTHLACALSYDQGMEAPRLVAKGKDLIAQSIVRVAREHDVPVVENREVARALYAGVEIEELVPPRLYAAVAEVILFVMQLESEEGKDV